MAASRSLASIALNEFRRLAVAACFESSRITGNGGRICSCVVESSRKSLKDKFGGWASIMAEAEERRPICNAPGAMLSPPFNDMFCLPRRAGRRKHASLAE
jgi:hypothetical protein